MVVYAYVNRGAWIAECPCTWALAVPRSFTELICGVLPDGRETGMGCGTRSRVQFPAEADDIEAVLEVRPTKNRNWRHGESVADLRIENASHQLESGLEVD